MFEKDTPKIQLENCKTKKNDSNISQKQSNLEKDKTVKPARSLRWKLGCLFCIVFVSLFCFLKMGDLFNMVSYLFICFRMLFK